jgi:tryptophan synthase beta chain
MNTYCIVEGTVTSEGNHCIAAGLDYPGIGPEHSYLKDAGRVQYEAVDDREVMAAFANLCRLEGIIPALESSHALAYLERRKGDFPADHLVIVNLSGRGDKDMDEFIARRNEMEQGRAGSGSGEEGGPNPSLFC